MKDVIVISLFFISVQIFHHVSPLASYLCYHCQHLLVLHLEDQGSYHNHLEHHHHP